MSNKLSISTDPDKLSPELKENLTNLNGPLSEVNNVADQLAHAVAGSFDFTIQVHSDDPIVQKLSDEVNFLLEKMQRTVSELEAKNKSLTETALTLQTSEERFRSVVQSASDAIVLANGEGNIIAWNKSAEAIFGYTEQEAWGQSLSMLMPERYRGAHQYGLERLTATSQPTLIGKTRELSGLTKDGREFPLELTLSAWQTGEDKFYSGIIHDITERKYAEKEWVRLVSVLEATSDCVITADAAGRILYLNTAGREMLKVNEAEDSTSTTIFEYYPQDIAPFIMNEALPVAVRDGVWEGETTLRSQTGGEISVSQVIMAHKARNGEVEFYSSIIRDISQRKQTEEALRQNEERFRQVVLSINAHVYVSELLPDGPALNRYISPNVEALTGYPLEKFLSDWTFWPSTLIYPEDRATAAAQVTKFAHSEYSEVEYRLTRADGQVIWVHDSGHVHKDSVSGHTVIYGFVTDVSQRKEAEATLEKSYSLLNATFESIADGIVVVDLAGETVAFNQRFVQMWNIPETIIKNTQERIDFIASQLKTSDKFQQRQKELTQQPEADGYDILELNDGRIFERYAKPQWLGDKIVGRVWNFRDITEQKRAEAALRHNEASMATAQRIAHVGNWETHIPTGHLFWSDEIYRIFGLAPQEFDATVEAFFAKVHPDDLEYVLKALDDVMARRKAYNVDHRIVRPSGEVRFVHQEAEVTFDEAGQPLRLLGTVQDVTERRQLEEQIQGLLERRSRQVQLSTQVAQEVALATNLDDLYRRVVTWINERFGFYHTQLLRYYPDTESLILRASYSETGQQILAEGQQVGLNEGLVGLATISGRSMLRSDVSTDPYWRTQPHLPDTQSELAVPITVGGEDPQIQVAALQHFVNSGIDGFAVMALDPPAVAPMAHKAMRASKPVIAISTDLGEQNQAALISTSERQMGYLLGQQAGKWAKKHAPSRKTIKIGLLVYGEPFGQIIEREKAIIEGFEDKFGANFIIIRKEIESSVAEGLVEWLKLHPDMNIVLGSTDALALGAYQAVIALDKNNPDTFFVGGVDAIAEALRAIKSAGAYQATVTQSPVQIGVLAIRTLVAALKGLPYEKVNPIDHVLVNSANVAKFLNKDGQMAEVEIASEDVLAGLDLSEIKIGFAVLNLTNPFFVAMVDSAQAEAERLGVQLVVNDPKRVLGVLDVQSNIAGLLNIEDQLVLEGLCGQIAIAIESTRLRQEMEERLRELNALQRLMSVEGWQAFQATREQATQAYLFDQTSIQATTLAELRLLHHETTQKGLAGATAGGNGHIVAKPIAVRGEIIGGLGIQNDADNPLLPEDQIFLDAVTEQVAEALERARLLEQTQKRAVEMEAVAQMSAITSTILDSDKLLQEVADLTKERFGLYHAQVYLLNEAGDTLNLAAGAGEVGRQMKAKGWSISIAREHAVEAQAVRARQAIIVSNAPENPDFKPNPLLPEIRSQMAVPLIVGDSVLGVLDIQANVINRFTDEDVRVQTTLAIQVAAALRNVNLYQQTQVALANFKQSQELLRITIDATPDWIFIKDRDHRYRLINQGYANSLHSTPEDMIGKNDLDLGFPEDIVKGNPKLGIRGFWPDDLEVMNSGKPKFIDVEPAFVDGRPVFLSTIKVPLRDASDNVWGVLGFVRDITQREQLLAEAENLYKASRRVNEAKDLQDIAAAVGGARTVSIINRILLFSFERNLLDQVEAMTVVANWHSGQGTPPSPIGRRYDRDGFSTVELMLSPEPLFFNDVQHDERMDAAIVAVTQQQNIRAMAVLPLQVGDRKLGVLILEAEEVHEFSGREIQFYLSLAPQIAVAIDNQRLLAETRAALAEVEQTQRRYTVQVWEAYRNKHSTLSHEHVREGVTPLGDNLLPEITQALAQSRRPRTNSDIQVMQSDRLSEDTEQHTQTDSSLLFPLLVRGETIGILGLQEIDEQRVWSPEEISLIGAICEQLVQAAENIRLIDETQQRAAREKRVNEIGEKIQAAQSLEEALQIAVKEVGLSLQTSQTTVKLEVQ